jgi:hypothetical protein
MNYYTIGDLYTESKCKVKLLANYVRLICFTYDYIYLNC